VEAGEDTEYNSFTMRIICTAEENQKQILAGIYAVLNDFSIESAEAEQREKGKYCVYKVPVRIAKDLPLPPLYQRLGEIKGIKTVL
jgi:putative lipoic acid-binding regulatory protein